MKKNIIPVTFYVLSVLAYVLAFLQTSMARPGGLPITFGEPWLLTALFVLATGCVAVEFFSSAKGLRERVTFVVKLSPL